MKKLILALTLLAFLLTPVLSFAAWTAVETRKRYNANAVIITIVLTGDASAGSYSVTTYLDELIGKTLYSVVVTPGAGGVAPDNTFDMDVEDADAFHLLDTDANSNTAKTWHLGKDTLGQYPIIKNTLSLVFADIGSAADQVTVEIVVIGLE